MWNTSNCQVKLLLNNRLDKNIQKIVQPVNIMLSLSFSKNYKISDSYITPCEKKYNILLFFIVLVFNLLCIFHVIANKLDDFGTNGITALFIIFLFFFYFLIASAISCWPFVTSFITAATFFLFWGSKKFTKKSVRNYIILNWILLSAVVCITIFARTIYFLFVDFMFLDISFTIINLAFDCNLVYSISLMSLLTKYLNEWVNQQLFQQNEGVEEYYDIVFVVYKNIFEAFKLYVKCFRELVRANTHNSTK